MFSDEEIKEIRDSPFMRPGDEIISIYEVRLSDKNSNNKKDDYNISNGPMLGNIKHELDAPRSPFRDGFFNEDSQQARFAWTEEDGNIASMVSEPGFGTTGETSFGRDLDVAFNSEIKIETLTSSVLHPSNTDSVFSKQVLPLSELQITSKPDCKAKPTTEGSKVYKVDKEDPRSRLHFVKYIKRNGRTVKLWECGICSREFQHQYTLMRHLPTHTNERNYHCNECGKSFRQLSTLCQHRAIHSAERPYSCEICSKSFNRTSTLISHRKIHSNEKPYKCHICPKGFHQKGNLRNHLFTHTNERPYLCNICYKGFNQQSNLVCHKNKAHPDENESPVDGKITSELIEKPPKESSTCTDSKKNIWLGDKLKTASNLTWGDSVEKNFGVLVDIRTHQMEVALASKQTPFALLGQLNSAPVLVKVVDTGSKQMLVAATAEDLKDSAKIDFLKAEDTSSSQMVNASQRRGEAVIRIPVVATVVPKIKDGGGLYLSVDEPHSSHHNGITADVAEVDATPERNLIEHDVITVIDTHDPYLESTQPASIPSLPMPIMGRDMIMPLFEADDDNWRMETTGSQILGIRRLDEPIGVKDDSGPFDFKEAITVSDSDD